MYKPRAHRVALIDPCSQEHRAMSKEAPASTSTTTTNVQLDPSYAPPPQRSATVTSPSPTRLGGRPSTYTGPRNRSPSSGAGGALADLAHQGQNVGHQLFAIYSTKTTQERRVLES